ncbi:MAG: YybH family protein [Bacteroidota bacterium]
MSATQAETEREIAAIQALNQQWEKYFEEHDPAGLAALFTEDCIRMPQGAPATIGRAALEEAYRQSFAEVWEAQAKVRLNAQEIVVAGEYAFARGADTLLQDQDGRQVLETGKWLFVYRRQPDGAWKYHWITFNSND